MVMFYWKLQWRVTFVICPLYIPPSFIRQPSGKWTGHKGMWLDGVKRMGEGWVSVFGERSGVTALWQHMSRPGSHTHTHTQPASSEWESAASSQQSVLICTLGNGLNDQMLDLMQNRHSGSPGSFSPLIRLLLLWRGCSFFFVVFF